MSRREDFATQRERVYALSEHPPALLPERDRAAVAAVLEHYERMRKALFVFAEASAGYGPEVSSKRVLHRQTEPYLLTITVGDLRAAAAAHARRDGPKLELVASRLGSEDADPGDVDLPGPARPPRL